MWGIKKKKKKKVWKLQKYKSECKKKNIAKGVIRIVQMCLPGNATTAPWKEGNDNGYTTKTG